MLRRENAELRQRLEASRGRLARFVRLMEEKVPQQNAGIERMQVCHRGRLRFSGGIDAPSHLPSGPFPKAELHSSIQDAEDLSKLVNSQREAMAALQARAATERARRREVGILSPLYHPPPPPPPTYLWLPPPHHTHPTPPQPPLPEQSARSLNLALKSATFSAHPSPR